MLYLWSVCGEVDYCDGWCEGLWVGCGEGFGEVVFWYFCMFVVWMCSFSVVGLVLVLMCEFLYLYSGWLVLVIFELVLC